MKRAWLSLLLIVTACGSDPTPADIDATPTNDSAVDNCAELTHSMVNVGEVSLRVGYHGCGPTIVMLHGFPEMSAEWDAARLDLAADFRVVVPDQRGYNLSDIPGNVADYETSHLVRDIAGLIDATTTEPVILVAHDWGGAVAWLVAHQHPTKVRGLVIMDAPHPDVFADLLANDPQQQQASSYMNVFIDPSAEQLLSNNDYAGLKAAFAGALSPELEATYVQAWSQPGALTGMLNWYRANIDSGPTPKPGWPTNVTIDVPTLVMWGMMDTALLPSNLDGLSTYVSDLTIREFDNADHWLVHRETAGVIAEIRAFAAGL